MNNEKFEEKLEDKKTMFLKYKKEINLSKFKEEYSFLISEKKLCLKIMKTENLIFEPKAKLTIKSKTKLEKEDKTFLYLEKIPKCIQEEDVKFKAENRPKLFKKENPKLNAEKKVYFQWENESILKIEIKDELKTRNEDKIKNSNIINLKVEEIDNLKNRTNLLAKLELKEITKSSKKNKYSFLNSIKNNDKNYFIIPRKFRNNYNSNKRQEESLTISFLFFFPISFIFFLFFFLYYRREDKTKQFFHVKQYIEKNCFSKEKKILKKDIHIKRRLINKKNNNIIRYKISFTNSIIICLVIIFSCIQMIFSNNKLSIVKSQFSNITLKIIGTGSKKVFSSSNNFNKSYYPNMIYINGEKQPSIQNSYDLNLTENNVELIWNNSINYCRDMFRECIDIIKIDLSNFNTSNVINMVTMFMDCSKLISLNLSNFDTSKVTKMDSMFRNCPELLSLDLSYFDTSNVISMGALFYQSSKLYSIDLSSFNTSKVTNMGSMFSGCSSLNSLNLSNFDTSNVVDMGNLFSGCSNLEYVNLKNFREESISTKEDIFNQVPDNIVVCLNNDSNIILSQIQQKDCYTIDCSDNWEINQKKIVNKNGICSDYSGNDISFKYEYRGRYFKDCSDGLVMLNFDIQSCECNHEKCRTCPNEPLKEDLCLECNNDYYPIENDNYSFIEGYVKCHKDPIGYYLDKCESIYKKCYYTCKECQILGNNATHNCLICDDNYPYNISKNNYSNCYDNSTYFDYFNNENIYIINSTYLDKYTELLVSTTEFIKNNETTNLIKDIKEFESNLVENLTEYLTNFEVNETEYLTENIINFKIKNLTENIIEFKKKELKDLIKDIIKVESMNETKEKNKEEEIDYYDTILDIIEKSFTSKDFDTSELDKGNDEIFETEKMKITLTTIQNQKNKMNDNITNIDLGDCELLLRNFYNLTNNKTLYMKQLEIIQEGMKIPKVEYDIYSKLSGTYLEKLNLSVCNNSKISLFIPVKINDNIDKINNTSGYYNDICYTATTESGTDISLKDRKNEYVNNTVCQDDCDFSSFNYTSQKAKCSCKVKESPSSFADMTINKDKLLDNIKNIKNYVNLNFLVCHKILFSKEGLLKNIGSYILISIIIFHIINMLIFYTKQFDLLKNKIKDIIYALNYLNIFKKNKAKEKQKDKGNDTIDNENNLDDINNNEINIYKKQNKKIISNQQNKKIKNKEKQKKYVKKESKHFEIKNKNIINNNRIIISNINSNDLFKINKNKKIERNSAKIISKKNSKTKDNNILNISKNRKNERNSVKILPKNNLKLRDGNIINKKIERNLVKILSKKNSKSKDNNILKLNKNKKIERNSLKILPENNIKQNDKNIKEKVKKIMDYKEDELNELSYSMAILYDKRTYCQYYNSLLRTKHILILSFCNSNNYNSRLIQIDIFFIGFTIYFTVNALFYNDDTMHKIYVNKGSFNIEYQLPKIIYSSFISLILNTLLKILALTNDSIIKLKQNKSNMNIKEKGDNLYNALKIRFVLYFIISFIFLFFFWYYISMFCFIYRNTQNHLLKDTLISFSLSLLYPLGIYLVPGFFRIYSLAQPKINREYLYKFSKILQIF